ncbi:MAG: assimilatory sulfite reductase (NADPH) flavoprotein subunit [Verrucomicrobiota bacterium]|nr:assimilatory sulfite reductase (NADPH) flavoprotein subunit [Verrucomicrobiota bacterium]
MSNIDPLQPSSPLSEEQSKVFNKLLPTLEGNQLQWIVDYLSNLRNNVPVGSAKPELVVLFGSESGNAEALAEQSVKAAKKSGFKAKALSMADIKPAKLSTFHNLLVIISTWGEGDPPESAIEFYEEFTTDENLSLKGVNYSVLGLGDTSYEHFCKMGKDFDSRLEVLGATRVNDRKDCDVDYDDDYELWIESSLAALSKIAGSSSKPTAHKPDFLSSAPKVPYSRKNPFPAKLKERVLLNGKGSAKETIHLELNLAGSGMDYSVGDALAVLPHNAEDVVHSIIEITKLNPDEIVSLKSGEFSVRDALTSHLDITAISKPVLTRYNEFAQNKELDILINDKDKLSAYTFGRQIIDVLIDFPAKNIDAQQLVCIMRKLPPRLYSIASSPKAHQGEVHLTVGVVRYNTAGRERKGVCSSFLADMVESGHTVDVYVSPNKKFRLPDNPHTPIIMVGPGTGIAPFRAFIEERAEQDEVGKSWLFFGDQHYLTDFLYQSEIQEYLDDGVLSKLDVAFSRDQAEKVYVQDKMLENATELYQWLEAGAVFYVCGDASRMAHDVDAVLHTIIKNEGKMDTKEAEDYVKSMKSENRYLRDVY